MATQGIPQIPRELLQWLYFWLPSHCRYLVYYNGKSRATGVANGSSGIKFKSPNEVSGQELGWEQKLKVEVRAFRSEYVPKDITER